MLALTRCLTHVQTYYKCIKIDMTCKKIKNNVMLTSTMNNITNLVQDLLNKAVLRVKKFSPFYMKIDTQTDVLTVASFPEPQIPEINLKEWFSLGCLVYI